MNKQSSLLLYLLAVVTTATIAWAYNTPIDVAIQAPGIVRPDGDVVHIVSESGGKITRVCGREGMTVHEGDVLVELDPRELRLKQRALESRIHATELHRHQDVHAHLQSLYQQLEQLQLELDRLTITSPSAGTISTMTALHPGEVLTAGTAIAAVIPRDHALVIESWLPANERRWVNPGQRVRVQPEELLADASATFDGVVVSISPDARVTESLAAYRVMLTPSPFSPSLQAGMTFRIHFITRQERLLWLLFARKGD